MSFLIQIEREGKPDILARTFLVQNISGEIHIYYMIGGKIEKESITEDEFQKATIRKQEKV